MGCLRMTLLNKGAYVKLTMLGIDANTVDPGTMENLRLKVSCNIFCLSNYIYHVPPGGFCQPCSCNGNIDVTNPDACERFVNHFNASFIYKEGNNKQFISQYWTLVFYIEQFASRFIGFCQTCLSNTNIMGNLEIYKQGDIPGFIGCLLRSSNMKKDSPLVPVVVKYEQKRVSVLVLIWHYSDD